MNDATRIPASARERPSSVSRAHVDRHLLDRHVDQFIWEQAARTPHVVAAIHRDTALTYAQLTHRADLLARRLQALGVRRGSLVGIHVERSLDMLVAMLAVMRAGAAYLPLDPDFPPDRLRYMMDDSQVSLVIVHSWIDDVEALGVPLLRIDQEPADCIDPGSERARAGQDHARGSDAVYVLYTSGSTGKPKGVTIEHRNLVNLLLSMRQEPGLGADDILLAITTLSFDIAALELLLPLVCGARVVIADAEDSRDGTRLLQLLRRHKVNVLQATPITWRLLIDSGWTGGANFKGLCGGEPMPPDLAVSLVQRCRELWNMYGPTETTVWSTCYRVPPSGRPLLVGRPIANTRVYVLDEARRPVSVDVAGEIYIAGDGVARGYLNRPELNAERFHEDPLHGDSGERMYRTGDLGRYLPDGNLQCHGRIDSQVKVRGFRIELGEIEAALAAHPQVAAAVVSAVERAPGDTRLVAYLKWSDAAPQPGDATALPVGGLRDHLATMLPHYMIPQHFMAVTSFPQLPNGKLDRARLPAPQWHAGAEPGDAGATSPATPAEQQLAAIWRRLLGTEKVGVDDNFIDLGGHSLLVTLAVSDIRNSFGVDLHPSRFAVETLAQLAASLEDGTQFGGDGRGGDDGATAGHTGSPTSTSTSTSAPTPRAQEANRNEGFFGRLKRRLARA